MHYARVEFECSEKVTAHLCFQIDFADEDKAMDAGMRLSKFFQFALKDPVCRAKFEAANPQGFRIIDIDDLNELVALAKEG